MKQDEDGDESGDSDGNEARKKQKEDAEDLVRKARYNLENPSLFSNTLFVRLRVIIPF